MRIYLLTILCFFVTGIFAQNITGLQKVVGNQQENYTITGVTFHPASNVNWTVTGGYILSSNKYNCEVIWDNGDHTGLISYEEDLYSYSGYLSVNVGNPVLNTDYVEMIFGINPGFIFLENLPVTESISDIVWQISYDNVTWSNSGSSGPYATDYDPTNATASFYLRATITYANSSVYVTNICYLYLAPLNGGTISLSTNATYNSSPQISNTAASGGACSAFQYQWEASYNTSSWNVIGTGVSFPSNTGILLSDDLNIRRKAVCGTEVSYSNTLSISPLYTSVDYENRNYVRENVIVRPGITSWYQADQLPTGQKFQTTNFLDGLGRSIQNVSKGTVLQNNIPWADNVAVHAYDALGREEKAYLPFATTSTPGKFKTNGFNEQVTFIQTKFTDNGNTFAKTEFENSSLGRVTKTILPGSAWAGIGPTITYDFNTTEVIKMWEIGYGETDRPSNIGNYPAYKLYKTVIQDEKLKYVVEYKDLNGNLILSKVQEKETNEQGFEMNGYGGWVCTYYVYDDFGRLRYTITPKAVNHLIDTYTVGGTWQVNPNIASELCFADFYDAKGRVIIKHTPGAGDKEIVYDHRDRIVFNRDAGDKEKMRWLINLSDGYNRPQSSGFIKHATNNAYDYSRSELQTSANDVSIVPVTTTVASSGNTGPIPSLHLSVRETWMNEYLAKEEIVFNPGFESENNAQFVAEIVNTPPVTQTEQVTTSGKFVPITATMITLTVNYYDDYAYPGAKPFSNNFSFPSTANPYVLPATTAKRTFGFTTGQKVRIIDDEDFSNDNFLMSTTYYDEYGQPLQQLSENYLQANNSTVNPIPNPDLKYDVLTNQYDFAGKLLASCFKQTVPGTVISNFPVITTYEHDLLGRVVSLSKSYNNSLGKKLVKYEYDELGQVLKKILSPDYINQDNPSVSGIETLNYDYNIQGWLTGINKNYTNSTSTQWTNYFGMELGYIGNSEFPVSQYNGSITGTVWKSQGDNKPRKYNYGYANTGYLKNAAFVQKETPGASWNTNKYDFSVPLLNYDANGNLTAMQQKGLIPGQTSPTVIDNLTYEYATNGELSNRLYKVTDGATTGTANGKLGDFSTTVSTQQYEYNTAGNLIKDHNKNIVPPSGGGGGIEYNVLNKPFKVIVAGKYIINYVYDATGLKLARKVTNTSVVPNTTKWQYFINDMVLEDYEVQFFINETGRLRVSKDVSFILAPAPQLNIWGNNGLVINGRPAFYDFYITDHLDNTRMILTEEEHSEYHKATMETADPRQKAYEEIMLGDIVIVNGQVQPAASNQIVARKPLTVPGWDSHYNVPGNSYGSKLNSSNPLGPNAFFKVMAGDKLVMSTEYYYTGAFSNNNGNIANAILTSLVTALTGSPSASSGVKGLNTQVQAQLATDPSFGSLLNNPNPTQGNNSPDARLNYLFFDENFNPIPYDAATGLGSYAKPVTTAGDNQSITAFTIKVPTNGYAFVYLSNNSNIDVWFDNFEVSHQRGRILQENHYYPYGLQIASISSKAAGKMDNMYRYQGAYSDFEEETGWNDFELRTYDAQIGRWTGVDPYDEFASTYTGLGNDPVNNIDPDGGCVSCRAEREAARHANSTIKYRDNGTVSVAWGENGKGVVKYIRPTFLESFAAEYKSFFKNLIPGTLASIEMRGRRLLSDPNDITLNGIKLASEEIVNLVQGNVNLYIDGGSAIYNQRYDKLGGIVGDQSAALTFQAATVVAGGTVGAMVKGATSSAGQVSRFGQIRGGIRKAQELTKSNHNLKLLDGKRIDLKGRHPLSRGHFNKTTKEQFDYPHVTDEKYPGGVRAPIANDYIEIFNIFK